jgi:PhnB protein
MQAPCVQPYLNFAGRCQEALAFYGTALGAQVDMVMLFKESPEPPPPGMLQPGFENKVVHTTFRIGNSVLMASDGCDDKASFNGFSLSYTAATEAEAGRAFAALSEGGKLTMPLTKTFWSPCFGMVTDRFGMNWMVTIPM